LVCTLEIGVASHGITLVFVFYLLINIFNALGFQILGVSPIEGFDMVKAAYAKKRKEGERSGDEAAVVRVGSLSLCENIILVAKGSLAHNNMPIETICGSAVLDQSYYNFFTVCKKNQNIKHSFPNLN
jgi:hypothetical protein